MDAGRGHDRVRELHLSRPRVDLDIRRRAFVRRVRERDRSLEAAHELLLRHRHEEQIARARTKAFVALGDGLALQDRDDPSALATHGRGQHLHRRREGSPGRSVENSNGVRARGGGRGSASIRQRHGKDVEATAFPEPVGESRQHLRIGEDE